MVFVMVVLGGVTRLTRSGLSIVEWRPTGEVLPTSEAEWAAEFDKYKAFPEFQRVNRHMTLEEFKPIYWMEWAHRAWGRAIGIAFAAPLLGFAAARMIPAGMWPRLGGLLALGATQGGIGWWMVQSGLQHERFDEHAVPRVSPYRLATHLGFAFAAYSALVWNGLTLLAPPAAAMAATLTRETAEKAARLTPVARFATALIATTVASGAFVAGNDAGHAYNDWPWMAGRLIPEQVWEEGLGARNLFENTATVQLDHRLLAYTTLLAVGSLHVVSRRAGGIRTFHPAVRRSVNAVNGLVGLQVVLGISTLMLYVPVPLAAVHQAGALALLTGGLHLLHTLKRCREAARLLPAAPAVATPAAIVAPPAVRAVAASVAAVAALSVAGGRDRDRDAGFA